MHMGLGVIFVLTFVVLFFTRTFLNVIWGIVEIAVIIVYGAARRIIIYFSMKMIKW